MKKYLDKREDQLVTLENLYKLAGIELKHNYFEVDKMFISKF